MFNKKQYIIKREHFNNGRKYQSYFSGCDYADGGVVCEFDNIKYAERFSNKDEAKRMYNYLYYSDDAVSDKLSVVEVKNSKSIKAPKERLYGKKNTKTSKFKK